MRDRGMRYWLPSWLADRISRPFLRKHPRLGPIHIIFLICDHFEPRHGIASDDQPFQRMAIWEKEYQSFFNKCKQTFGHAPRHTWFYPPHHGLEHLATLARMAHSGLGEVEFHYHHDGDTSETLRKDLSASIAAYNRRGLLLLSGNPPRTSFGFIHGDWALDNSAGGRYCGVNDELTILRELGCWGDFTMPSANECQTRKINSVYYAIDDPNNPKSHDTGIDVTVGTKPPGNGLFMMQGPLGLNFFAPGYPRLENASLTTQNWGRPDRVQAWLNAHVHVRGRTDWVFVKLHTHGAVEKDYDAIFGEKAWKMHAHLNEVYNDGKNYVLHYATAREAYNLCKAAEQGLEGHPDEFRNHILPPLPSAYYCLDIEHDLVSCAEDRLSIANIDSDAPRVLRSKLIPLICGRVGTVTFTRQAGMTRCAIGGAQEDVTVQMAVGAAKVMVIVGELIESTVLQGDLVQLCLRPHSGQIHFTVHCNGHPAKTMFRPQDIQA